MPNNVTQIAPASAADAEAHFSRRLAFETDCWDVHDALSNGARDFVVLDVRGRAAYAAGHVPGAVSLPHTEIDQRRMDGWPADTLFVVYCAGPHCNGANKAFRPDPPERLSELLNWSEELFLAVYAADCSFSERAKEIEAVLRIESF